MSSNNELRSLRMKEWLAKADVALANIWRYVKQAETKQPSLKKLICKFSVEPYSTTDNRHLGLEPHVAIATFKQPLVTYNKAKDPSHSTDLKHARRRIKLAYDFDLMLQQGFPTQASLLGSHNEHEYTLYISLTPQVAQPIN